MSPSQHIITTRTDNGPVMAIDLRTLPPEITSAIIKAALNVSINYENGGLDCVQDDSPTDDILLNLSISVNAINAFMKPVAPAPKPLRHSQLLHSYPVLRHGEEVTVPVSDMSELEIEATIHHLHSEELTARERIDTLKCILASGKVASDTGAA